jgi:tetraacyldisaccharide 4'-kinase
MSAASGARRLLLPLTPAYRLALALRELGLRAGTEQVRKLWWPVVSVGSLSAGGAGKTPLTIAVAKALAARGIGVDVISRGYGRTNREPARVQLDGTADQFGDEPLLIAQQAGVPVVVAAQRYDAGQLAEQDAIRNGALLHELRVHVLDDGFQHRQLHRDVDIVLASREDWRDHLLPAGNLREALHAAARAHVIAIPEEEPEFERELKAWGWQGPVWRVLRKIDVPVVDGTVAAFCGIARPEQFFSGLEAAGLKLAIRTAFADHHRYSGKDLERVVASARSSGAAALITTEKDRVRLGTLAASIPQSVPLLTAGLRIELDNDALDWLENRLRAGWDRLTTASL